MRKLLATTIYAAVVLMCSGSAIQAAVIAGYDFDAPSSNSVDPHPATTTDPNTTVTDLVGDPDLGSIGGISGGGNDLFSRATLVAATLADAIAANDYVSFTVTPNAGFQLNLTDLSWDWGAVTIDDGEFSAISLFSSVGGFANPSDAIATTTNTADSTGVTLGPSSFDLSGAAFQGLTGTTEFRLYYTSDADIAGDLTRLDNLTLNGGATVVPEPSAALLCLLGVLGVSRRCRRG